MNKTVLLRNQTRIFLGFLLLITLLTRFYNLDFQSLWKDELFSMVTADPDISFSAMFEQLRCCDQHPPLHYAILKALFSVFGYTSWIARVPSAIAATISVWAIYLLGREIKGRNLGLIAAGLTAFNFYNLQYGQEARDYMFAFLFTILSFLYLVRLLKTLSIKNSIWYALFTLLLMYSHYYGLFIIMSQLVLIGLLFFKESPGARKRYFSRFALSGLIMVIGYLPWVPSLLIATNIKTFWIEAYSHSFLLEYFNDYFGRADGLNFLLPLLLLFYSLNVFYAGKLNAASLRRQPWPIVLHLAPVLLFTCYALSITLPYSMIMLVLLAIAMVAAYAPLRLNRTADRLLQYDPLNFSFVLLSCWVLVASLVPYLRSIFVIPMLQSRYTIVLLPAILLAIAYAVELINHRTIKMIVMVAIVALFVRDLIQKEYYTWINKAQLREAVQYMVDNNQPGYPVINEISSFEQQYYFRIYRSHPVVLYGKKADMIDSILQKKSPQYDLKGFWIIGANGDPLLTGERAKKLDSSYELVKDKQYFYVWAQLYVARDSTPTGLHEVDRLVYTDFNGNPHETYQATRIDGDSIQSKKIRAPAGSFQLQISAGRPGNKASKAHLLLFANDKKIGDLQVGTEFETIGVDWEVPVAEEVQFMIKPADRQSRRAFMRSVRVLTSSK